MSVCCSICGSDTGKKYVLNAQSMSKSLCVMRPGERKPPFNKLFVSSYGSVSY